MVNSLAQDTQGSLWVGANLGLFRRHRNGEWEHYGTESGLGIGSWFGTQPIAFVNSFARDTEGRLWVAFKGGFGRIVITPRPGAPVLDFVQKDRPESCRRVRALWFGSDGRRWIASESGLWEWVVDTNGACRFRGHAIQDAFPGEAFLSIREDAAGNLWTGTRRSGLVQMGRSRFRTYGAGEGLRLGLDQRLLETRSGQVVVIDIRPQGTRVYRRQEERWVATIPPGLPEPGVSVRRMAMEDREGAWWFSTPSGLYRFPALAKRHDLRLLPESGVDLIFEDSVGDIWISHWPRGESLARLARWERRTGRVHDESERLPPDAWTGIVALAKDRAGVTWIATQVSAGRLLRLKDGRFQRLFPEWRGNFTHLFVDSKGRVWAASVDAGLGVIEDPHSPDPQLRRYSRAEGLSADEVWCITEDRMGRIYVGTAKGVDRLDPGTGRIVHYSSSDGLVRGDIRSTLRDRNGDLWFVSPHGVSRLTPGEDSGVAPARARITGFIAAGVPLPLSDLGESEVGPLRVSSHQDALQVDFVAIHDQMQAPLRYQFRLDRDGSAGATESWLDLGSTPTVRLFNLASGDYSLQVRALTRDGLSGEPALVTFSVLLPLWQTWWFQLACAMTVAGVVWRVRTRRLQQQLALQRVRSHIAMDLHDDIGAGLSRISVLGEVLKSRLRESDADVQGMLDDIADSSRQLVTDMGDIVWALDSGRDQMKDLASRLRAFGSDLLEKQGMEWTVEGAPDSLRRSLAPALKRQLYLVFREGIHNVAKHSGATRAALRFWVQDGYIWGELMDDGCGIASTPSHGNGFPNMRERVKQLGGRMEVTRPGGGGTSIRIKVPH
jgi:signal transduction histidine kinase/ligand-binding sensor domain-containing protein